MWYQERVPIISAIYLLVMEGLSRLIIEDKNRGLFKGVKISSNISLTHLLFIDDVLIFRSGEISDSIVMNGILNVFFKATRMMTNHEKSTLAVGKFSPNELSFTKKRFPFR